MKIIEYRIPIHATAKTYEIGHDYTIEKVALEELLAGRGGEVGFDETHAVTDPETGEKGKYTRRTLNIGQKLPSWLRPVVPSSVTRVTCETWDYPLHSRSLISSARAGWFSSEVLTRLVDGYDPNNDNVFGLTAEELAVRKVDVIDVVNDDVKSLHLHGDADPTKWHSEKTNRGPLGPNWIAECTEKGPMMCAYKLARVNVSLRMIGRKIESQIHATAMRATYLGIHRKLTCWMDDWVDMTPEQLEQFTAGIHSKLVLDPEESTEGAGDRSLPSTSSIEIPDNESLDEEVWYDTEDVCSAGRQFILVVHGNGLLGGASYEDDYDRLKETFESICGTLDEVDLQFASVPCLGVTMGAVAALAVMCPKGTAEFVPSEATICLLGTTPQFRQAVDRLPAKLNEAVANLRLQAGDKVHVLGDVTGALVLADVLVHKHAELSFDVDSFFSLGSPIGLHVLHQYGSTPEEFRPKCKQVFNFYQQGDPFAYRLEPLLDHQFSNCFPVILPDFIRFPQGVPDNYDALKNLIEDTEGDATELSPTFMQCGSQRLDYEVLSPPGLSKSLNMGLIHLMHAGYWECYDIVAHICRQIFPVKDQDEGASLIPRSISSTSTAPTDYDPSSAPSSHHRTTDFVFRDDEKKVISATLSYGLFRRVKSKQAVTIFMCSLSKARSWEKVGTATASNGKVSFEVPESSRFARVGMFRFQFFVDADTTVSEGLILVTGPKQEAVVFSIDGSFSTRFSMTGKRLGGQQDGPDVVRFWERQGYVIIYVTARPMKQKRNVLSYLAKHNFPVGLTWFCDTLCSVSQAEALKRNYLVNLFKEKNIVFSAAYGSERSVPTYHVLDVEPERLFVLDGSPSPAYSLIQDGEYAEHITKLNERFIRRRDSKAGDDSFTSLTFDPPRRSRDPSQLVE